ncbi:MAG: hypothetical protein EOO92_25915, partial [Pedobacter sp.]
LGLFLLFLQPVTGQYNFTGVDDMLQKNEKALGKHVVALVWKDGKIVYKKEIGEDFNAKTQVAVGASGQWLAAAVSMIYVDEGKITLDTKAGKLVPLLAKYMKGYINLRHCLTHTTGLEAEKGGLGRLMPKSKFESLEEEVDYFINENNTIGLTMNGYLNNYYGSDKINTTIGHQSGQIDSSVLGQNSFISQYKSQTYNLNYKSMLDTLGQELNADLDFSKVHNIENAYYDNDFFNAGGLHYRSPVIFRNLTPSKIKIVAGKLDYLLPLPNKMKLETGIKSSYVNTDNDFRSEQQVNDAWTNDVSQSNRFSYKENVNAAYVNLHKDLNSTTVQVGLRTELTHTEGKSITLQDETIRDYIDFFPSISVNQTLSKGNTIGISYTRRIDRPDYQALNP